MLSPIEVSAYLDCFRLQRSSLTRFFFILVIASLRSSSAWSLIQNPHPKQRHGLVLDTADEHDLGNVNLPVYLLAKGRGQNRHNVDESPCCDNGDQAAGGVYRFHCIVRTATMEWLASRSLVFGRFTHESPVAETIYMTPLIPANGPPSAATGVAKEHFQC